MKRYTKMMLRFGGIPKWHIASDQRWRSGAMPCLKKAAFKAIKKNQKNACIDKSQETVILLQGLCLHL